MGLSTRIVSLDEEKAKKDDDHGRRPLERSWTPHIQFTSLSTRKVIYALGVFLFVFLLYQNWLDASINSQESQYDAQPSDESGSQWNGDSEVPPIPASFEKAQKHYFEGPIRFYQLATSLHAAASLGGQSESKNNVAFAASSLRSVAELLPLACMMARRQRNHVHLIILGRDDMSLNSIKELNGIQDDDCLIHWHDARPDYALYSTSYRMETSIAAALEHVCNFMHPQVFIIDAPEREDRFFVDGFRAKAAELFKPVIELPINAIETMKWMTRLDSSSLAAWPKVSIDIFIQAPKASSGSFIRLLKSIESANYFGSQWPHITIELPADVDPPSWSYLQNFVWPRAAWTGEQSASQVTLRHRVARRTTSREEAAARLVEGFYPKRIGTSHVLLLSSNAELSPWFYHYMFYHVLEHKHSHMAMTADMQRVIGISLELPDVFLNDTTDFHFPSTESAITGSSNPAFRWQSPNSHAAVYFADKWIEFHSFLSGRVSRPPSKTPRQVSDKYPAWLEFLSEFMRARGYSLIYPAMFDQRTALVTLHEEAYQVPEETLMESKTIDRSKSQETATDGTLHGDFSSRVTGPPKGAEYHLIESLTLLLGSREDETLPHVAEMPLLSFEGQQINNLQSAEIAQSFAAQFRQTIGGCNPQAKVSAQKVFSADDLFCQAGEMYDYFGDADIDGPRQEQYDELQEKAKPSAPVSIVASANHSTTRLELEDKAGAQVGKEQQRINVADIAGPNIGKKRPAQVLSSLTVGKTSIGGAPLLSKIAVATDVAKNPGW